MDFTNITVTTGELLTVAGAGAAAAVVAQFSKKLLNLSAKWTRSVAMLAGLVVVVAGTAIDTGGVGNPLDLLLAVIVGMQAGLSASAAFDAAHSGLDHKVFTSEVVASDVTGLYIDDSGELEINEAKVED